MAVKYLNEEEFADLLWESLMTLNDPEEEKDAKA